MLKQLKFAWSVLLNELSLVSERKGIGGDTLLKCILIVAFSVGFYLWVYSFNYETPNPRKIEWHRMIAGGMALVGIISAVGEYSICLWRRIQKRRLQALSRDVQMNS